MHLTTTRVSKSTIRFALTPLVFIVVASFFGSPTNAADAEALTTWIYPVADLLELPLGDEEKAAAAMMPAAGGRMIGGGGGGGGGGGVFCVPDNVLGQLGGGGFGGGGGMGGFSTSSHFPWDRYVFAQTIADLLTTHTKSEAVTWDNLGGEGRISVLGTSLIITQNVAGHDAVAAVLDILRESRGKRMPIQVELRLIEIDSKAAASVNDSGSEVLNKLAQSEKAMMLSLRCENHHVGKISSGLSRSYIVSAIPVVGGNGLDSGGLNTGGGRSVGYSPQIETKMLGIFGHVRPMIGRDKTKGRIQLSIGLSSGPEETLTAEFSDEISLDRVEIETTRLNATATAAANQWTVAGVTTVADSKSILTSGQALPHIVTLVRWSAAQ